jgi:pentatricopeptide repeat protein
MRRNGLALRAVQILPTRLTDERTYNMLVSVCVKGRDLVQAMHAADMLRTTGRRLDTILYTNLIGGAFAPHASSPPAQR